ncbi:MAG: LysE family transporter [Candidatus Krumholzibacteriota bacterium]|nr:LysE family transporter [Candidatus Krumholzibacteriota bacterium]
MIGYIIFGATYAFAAAAQPGPLMTFLISQTLSRGWRRTLPAALAPLLSDVPIIILALFVLSRVPSELIKFLHFAGALFIFFLSFKTFRTWRRFDADSPGDDHPGRQALFRAVLVNILNPAPYLGWSLVLGPLFLKGFRETPANGIALLLAFYLTMTLSLVGIISVFAFARNLGPRVNRVMLGLSVVGLACFGVYQLWLGFSS